MLSNDRNLVLRARVLSRSIVTGAALVLAFGPPMADSNVAWAQCDTDPDKLLASDGTGGDQFGYSVALSRNVALVGANFGSGSGSAYVFRFDGSGWTEQQKLLPSDGMPGVSFGFSVAVSDDIAVVGAKGDDDNGVSSGSAYVYRFDGLTWIEEQKLLASDGAPGDRFGWSVAVSQVCCSEEGSCQGGLTDQECLADGGILPQDDVAVVGAYGHDGLGSNSGSAYVYRFDGSTWIEEQELLASDGAQSDDFGYSVAVSGHGAIVGAPGDDDLGTDSGSSYVFRFNGADWLQESKLLGSDGIGNDKFGGSVAVSDDVAVVGAHRHDDLGASSGSAYVFRFDGSSWIEESELLASDGALVHHFGRSVSVSSDAVVVGAYNYYDGDGLTGGAAYLFGFNGSGWIEETKLLAPDGAADDRFGWSVAVSDDMALVGGYKDDDNGLSRGSAWVFQDGTVGAFDLSIVLGAWGPNPGHPADFNGDGVVNPTDLALVLGVWGPCP